MRLNRPGWSVVEGDLRQFSGLPYKGVDLLAGGLLCLTVESALREPVRPGAHARLRLIAGGGVAVIVGLMLCVRYLSEWMAASPIMFGALIIGSLATLSCGFYVTFFSRPGVPAPAIERLTGEESESPAA